MAHLPRWLARLLRRRTPAGTTGSGRGGDLGPGWRDDGGAGVREPRRPCPAPSGASAAAAPEPTQVLGPEADEKVDMTVTESAAHPDARP